MSALVSRRLGVRCVSIEEVARKHGLIDRDSRVDTKALRVKLATWTEPSVLYGHLLPQVLPKAVAKSVVVLRCDPTVLKERLSARGYPAAKVRANVEAELIGLISADSLRAFGKATTLELDTTESEPSSLLRYFEEPHRARPGPLIDWTLSYASSRKLRSLLS